MGEITELILQGVLCSKCGSVVSLVEVGFPQTCEYCSDDENDIE